MVAPSCSARSRHARRAFGNPEDAVTRKAQRIRRLALRWLDAHDIRR
ncbi:MAG: hypothetical protein R2699_10055 [Acidimicrobiales bacterium]